jgi:zinc D-Ala-D-Ala carboxypeptidase
MKLSKHFELEEFLVSETAARLGIDNTPPTGVHLKLERLAKTMDEVRELLGHPVIITSGYRSPILNMQIGGVKNSDHVLGLAADFICPRYGPPAMVCKAIRDSQIQFRQLINEFNKWTHIAIPLSPEDEGREVMSVFTPGVYLPGLPIHA